MKMPDGGKVSQMMSWGDYGILVLVMATGAPIIWLLLRSASPAAQSPRAGKTIGNDGVYGADTAPLQQHSKAAHHYSGGDTDGYSTNSVAFDSGSGDGGGGE